MTYHDIPYLNLIEHILRTGYTKTNRTGEDTIGIFGYQMRFDLSDNTIPLLTTKKIHTKSIIHELLWFLQGNTNIKYLNDNGVTIWDEWADENGDLGPGYGHQWRNWDGIDQITNVINSLRNNPDSRRHIISAWNVADIDDMKLPPCHCLFQFNSRLATVEELNASALRVGQEAYDMDNGSWYKTPEEYFTAINIPLRRLDCQLYQRSCDVGLGVPFNIAQYSILLHMVAKITNHLPGDFIWTGGDVHIYKNHIDGLSYQLNRQPFESPKLFFNRSVENIDDFEYNDFIITDYECHPLIKFDVAV